MHPDHVGFRATCRKSRPRTDSLVRSRRKRVYSSSGLFPMKHMLRFSLNSWLLAWAKSRCFQIYGKEMSRCSLTPLVGKCSARSLRSVRKEEWNHIRVLKLYISLKTIIGFKKTFFGLLGSNLCLVTTKLFLKAKYGWFFLCLTTDGVHQSAEVMVLSAELWRDVLSKLAMA